MSLADLPPVVVLYDQGAASPFEILRAARKVCRVVLAFDGANPRIAAESRDLTRLGATLDLTGLDESEAADAVRDLAPAGITTFSEFALPQVSTIARAAALPANDESVVRNLTDKIAQRRTLAESGVDVVRFATVATAGDLRAAVDEVGLPAVLKPARGAGSRDTYLLSDREDVAVAADALPGRPAPAAATSFVLEELLVGDPGVAGPEWGDYVSVDSVTTPDGRRHFGVTGKLPLAPPFREQGMVFPAPLDPSIRFEALRLAERALDAVGMTWGISHVELKLTASGPRVIEVNGRLGGDVGWLVRTAAGVDPTAEALRNALGEPPSFEDVECSAVAFTYLVSPPLDAVALHDVRGIEDVAKLPGIVSATVETPPGEKVDWRWGTECHAALVCGRAETHAGVLQLLGRVQQTLDVEWVT